MTKSVLRKPPLSKINYLTYETYRKEFGDQV